MSAGTILVVDYHAEVVHVAVAALARAGYSVLTASSVEEGLGVVQERADVDLVISEAEIPSTKTSGLEFVQTIKQAHPSTAVMLMTGFTDQALDPEIPLLEKPFSSADLVEGIQRALAKSRRQAEVLQESKRAMQASIERHHALRSQLESAIDDSCRILNQCRRQRAEWFCARLREANAVKPTVLVAEEDAACRDGICRVLSQRGLAVLEASTGTQALELMRECGGRVDMLVTGVRMPGMDGVELAGALAAEYPQTSIVFVTDEDMALPHPAVQKPFDPEDLLALVAEKLIYRFKGGT